MHSDERPASEAYAGQAVYTARTRYYLEHWRIPVPEPRLTLLARTRRCSVTAADRGARHRPATHLADALASTCHTGPSGSVGLSHVLHCMPGPITEKTVTVADNVMPLLEPGGVFFGATMSPTRHATTPRAGV